MRLCDLPNSGAVDGGKKLKSQPENISANND